MKKLLFTMIAFTLLASCSKDTLESGHGTASALKPQYNYSFSTKAEYQTSTNKTRVDFDASNKKFSWNKGDKILALYAAQGQDYKTFNQQQQNGSNLVLPFIAEVEGSSTTFKVTGTNATFEPEQTYNYKAIFPFPQKVPTGNQPIPYTIPEKQTSSFDGQYNLMFASVQNAQGLTEDKQQMSGANPTLKFQHLTTQIAFYVKDPSKNAPEGYEITGLIIYFPNKSVTGEIEINPYSTTEDYSLTIKKPSNKVSVKFKTPVKPVETFSQESAALITCLPFTVESGETFNVTILGRSPQYSEIRQTITCAPKKAMAFNAGDFRKINLSLKNDFKYTKIVKTATGATIQDLLGDPLFAPSVEPWQKSQVYGANGDGTKYVQPETVIDGMTFKAKTWSYSSAILSLPVEGSNERENVIVLDNTKNYPNSNGGTFSAFYLPVADVLPNFQEKGYRKKLRLTFKAYIIFCGYQDKSSATISLTTNHIDSGTDHFWGNSGFRTRATFSLPAQNAHFTHTSFKPHAQMGYPAVNFDKDFNQGWVEYDYLFNYDTLKDEDFVVNSSGTPAYIGFIIENWAYNNNPPACLLYIKDIVFAETDREPIANNQGWMANITTNPLISQMSLPGTHDAATYTLNDSPSLKCQQYSITEQLNKGVRVFDLRPSATPNLMMTHSSTPTNVTLEQAIQDMKTFLEKNPREFCIAMLKNENGSDQDWATHMGNYIDKHRQDFNSANTKLIFANYKPELHLDDVRGQILLLSRNQYNGELVGGQITPWSSNTSSSTTIKNKNGETETLLVQDNFISLTYPNKKDAITTSFVQARENKDTRTWSFNYLSLAGNVWTPYDNAKELNPWALNYLLNSSNKGKTGVVFMDFAGLSECNGDALLYEIIQHNF